MIPSMGAKGLALKHGGRVVAVLVEVDGGGEERDDEDEEHPAGAFIGGEASVVGAGVNAIGPDSWEDGEGHANHDGNDEVHES